MQLNKLFFIPNTRPLEEIPNYYSLEDFYNVLVEECNFCNNDSLNVKRLNELYKKYVDVFISNKGKLKDYFLNEIQCKRFMLKPYAVFGESLWKKTKSTTSQEYYLMLGYDNETAKNMVKERQSLTSPKSFKKRYGDDWEEHYNGYIKKHREAFLSNPNIDEIRKRRVSFFSYKHYLTKINPDTNKLYTEDEAKEHLSKIRSISSQKSADMRRGKSDVTCRSVQYWINKGFTEDDAKNKVREIQSTNNIDVYINKYGEQEGIKRWVDRNKKWGKIMQEKKMKSGHIGSAYSQSSKLFFDGVVKKLKDNNISFNKVYYGEEEFCKWDSEYKRPYFYDFVIPDIYLCVEYNGLKFHPKEGDIQWIGLYGDTYEYKIQYDKRKLEVIENCGYKTLVIWEDDDLDKMSDYIVSLFK